MKAMLLAACVLAGCGDDSTASDGGGDDVAVDAAIPVDVPEGVLPREVITETLPLQVTEVVEYVMEGGVGDYARIIATVTTPPSPALDWNIHGHANGGTQVVSEELRVMQMDYLFQPTATADWYLLMRNKGQTNVEIDVRVELYGAMVWKGKQ